MEKTIVHNTAEIEKGAKIGKGSSVWHHAQIRKGAKIGMNCIIGKGVYIDSNVTIGNKVKIQNGCFVYRNSRIEGAVFLGPGVILTNDNYPRSTNIDGSLKTSKDWKSGKILIKNGASIGAGSIVLTNITIGKFAMIGAGSVVTKNIPNHGLALGIPARLVGFVCICGKRLETANKIKKDKGQKVRMSCKVCKKYFFIPKIHWQQLA